jgi:hypothetical protein
MSLFHRGTHELEMVREEHGHTGGDDLGIPGKKIIPVDYYAVKVTVSGTITYVALALPGTAQSTAKWQVKKVDETTGTIITWADGNADFDNVATDLTALTYS